VRCTAPALCRREQHSRRLAYCQAQAYVSWQTDAAPTRPPSTFFLALPRMLPYTLIARANLDTERMTLYGNTDGGLLSLGYGTRCRTGATPARHASGDLPAGRSERTRMLSRQAGIAEVPTHEQLVREADLLLSILVPEEALNTARVVAQALRSAGATTLYADCNAVSPRTVRAIAEVITEAAAVLWTLALLVAAAPGRTSDFMPQGPM